MKNPDSTFKESDILEQISMVEFVNTLNEITL
jgi:hypothetical protein